MPIQQQKPRRIGFPPLFTNLTIFVFRPIAAIARIIKNLLIFFIIEVKLIESIKSIVKYENNVVKKEARIKYKINVGKMFFILILL